MPAKVAVTAVCSGDKSWGLAGTVEEVIDAFIYSIRVEDVPSVLLIEKHQVHCNQRGLKLTLVAVQNAQWRHSILTQSDRFAHKYARKQPELWHSVSGSVQELTSWVSSFRWNDR